MKTYYSRDLKCAIGLFLRKLTRTLGFTSTFGHDLFGGYGERRERRKDATGDLTLPKAEPLLTSAELETPIQSVFNPTCV
jgi:hypothetical protein